MVNQKNLKPFLVEKLFEALQKYSTDGQPVTSAEFAREGVTTSTLSKATQLGYLRRVSTGHYVPEQRMYDTIEETRRLRSL